MTVFIIFDYACKFNVAFARRSVKKEDMDRAELDAFLRQITPREQFYLDNPGAPSPRFKTMEHRTVRDGMCYTSFAGTAKR